MDSSSFASRLSNGDEVRLERISGLQELAYVDADQISDPFNRLQATRRHHQGRAVTRNNASLCLTGDLEK